MKIAIGGAVAGGVGFASSRMFELPGPETAILTGIGVASGLATIGMLEATGNAQLAAGVGIGSGALVGAALWSLRSGGFGVRPVLAGLALGAALGGVATLVTLGTVTRMYPDPSPPAVAA